MARIEGIRIRNYRVLKDITLGSLWNTPQVEPLTPLTTVIGKNGVGKSSLFDCFRFLADCLRLGVEAACDSRGRGGFQRIRSQGTNDPLEFEVHYRENPESHLTTYELAIDIDEFSRPYVVYEGFHQQLEGQRKGQPHRFLWLEKGEGLVWKGESLGPQLSEGSQQGSVWELIFPGRGPFDDNEQIGSAFVELRDKRKLGIATIGGLEWYPRISVFKEFVEGWYMSHFTPDSARRLPMAGPQRHLNVHGDNLGNVVQFMKREHGDRFNRILERIASRVPGINRIDTEYSPDGRLLLRFNDQGFEDPFYAQQVSDGTLKLFAYMLMLEDPDPPPFICIEEPENGLYHRLLEVLAYEFRDHATRSKHPAQILVTTHQPYFIDSLSPEEAWVLEKQADGFSTIRRASDDRIVKAMADEGVPLGGLWYSEYLD